MRKLLVTRGVPGCGKSTWIKNNNLEAYTISPDSLRLLYMAPILNEKGKLQIAQANDRRVWEFLYSLVEERMERGDFIVIDGTHKNAGSFSKYLELANKYFYSVACVDFSSVPLDVCLAQNSSRDEYKQVPEEVVKSFFDAIKNSKVPNSVTTFSHTDADAFDRWANSQLNEVDLNQYEKVHVIGDIQGCYAPLEEYFKDGFNENQFYIFTGDFLDRGIQNGEVLEWAVKNLTKAKNVAVLCGNHELHLMRWATGFKSKSDEFEYSTLPQIEAKNIKKEEAYSLCRKMKDVFLFTYGDIHFIASHAGVAKLPAEKLYLLPSKTFWNGVGQYTAPIDDLFSQESPSMVQFHGHRNKKGHPVHASSNSFNLESRVEFGGNLRAVILEKN